MNLKNFDFYFTRQVQHKLLSTLFCFQNEEEKGLYLYAPGLWTIHSLSWMVTIVSWPVAKFSSSAVGSTKRISLKQKIIIFEKKNLLELLLLEYQHVKCKIVLVDVFCNLWDFNLLIKYCVCGWNWVRL